MAKTRKASTEATAPATAAVRTLTGTVASSKMHKTISVVVERLVKHPQYGKYVRRTTKLLAHDEDNSSRAGDLVTITECRPYSKRKAWKLVGILKRAEAPAEGSAEGTEAAT
ncbi:MAG: 30S ribosomal protein S17 [Gammaproteobacteria bacterium PRO9]|nr:30S ribosomal protein S17 [Gammaproteobacteria bacterium PRO9]